MAVVSSSVSNAWLAGVGAAAAALVGGGLGYVAADVWTTEEKLSPVKAAGWKMIGAVVGTGVGSFLAGAGIAFLTGASSKDNPPKISPAGTSIAVAPGPNSGVTVQQGSQLVLNVAGTVESANSDSPVVRVDSAQDIAVTLRAIAPGMATVVVKYKDLSETEQTSTITVEVQ